MDIRKLNEEIKNTLNCLYEEETGVQTFIPDNCLAELKKYNFYNTTTQGQARMKKVFLHHELSNEINPEIISNNVGIYIIDNGNSFEIARLDGYYGIVQMSYRYSNWKKFKTLDELIKELPSFAEQLNNAQLQKLEDTKAKNAERKAKADKKDAERKAKHPDWYDENGNYLGSPAKRKRDAEEEAAWREQERKEKIEAQKKLNELKQFGLDEYYYNDNKFSLDKTKDPREIGGVEFSSWEEGSAELWIPASVQKSKGDGHWTQPKNVTLRYPIREKTKNDAIKRMMVLLNNREYSENEFINWFKDNEYRSALSGLHKIEPIIQKLNKMSIDLNIQ